MKWFTIIKIFMSLNQYKKILVIKHGSLGDITFALPAMNSIRIYFKYSAITLLTESKFVKFLKKSQNFDHFLIDDRKGLWKTTIVILKVFSNNYDLVIDLQNSKRTNFYNFIFRFLSKAKISGSRSNAHYRYIIPEQGTESATAGLFKQLSMLNILENKTDYNWLNIDLNLNNFKNFILFIPGVSKSGLHKQWKPGLFAQLAKHFENKGYKICVIGTKIDYPSIKPILKECKNVINKIDQSPPEVVYTIAKNSHLIISNDTGPGHIAALSNTNILWLGLNNSISKSNLLQWKNSFTILAKTMNQITVAQVIEYINKNNLLNK